MTCRERSVYETSLPTWISIFTKERKKRHLQFTIYKTSLPTWISIFTKEKDICNSTNANIRWRGNMKFVAFGFIQISQIELLRSALTARTELLSSS